ncbi:MAG: hypothetical protein NC433_07765 [Clostridiales bacterium]|nr:hypothetical protein [Clostridiales bacterium]
MKNIGIVLYLFVILYCPQFGRINTSYIIGIVTWIYILFFYQRTLTSMKNKGTQLLYFSLGCTFIYALINSFINFKISRTMLVPFFYWVGIIFPALYLVMNKCYDNHFNDEEKFIELLLIVGNIQGGICLFIFIFPEIRDYYLGFVVRQGIVRKELIENVSSFRYYGVSANVISYMPLMQIVLALLALWLFVTTKSKKYLAYFPLLAFSAFINARTPFLIFILGIAILIFCVKKNIKRLSRLVFIITMIVLILALLYWYLCRLDTVFSQWYIRGLRYIFELFQGRTTYGANTGLKFIAPHDFLGWLVGSGDYIIHGNSYGEYTDMGYANYLWLGGITYIIILVLTYFFVAKTMIRLGVNIYIVELLYMIILVYSIKMPLLYANNEFMKLFYAIYIWNVVMKYRNNQVRVYKIQVQ